MNNNWITWLLPIAALAVGYNQYGWQGVIFAITLIVFWLLMQFNRINRVMKQAASNKMGYVVEAKSFNLRLRKGQSLFDVVKMTRSLGEPVRQVPETYRWADDDGDAVEVIFEKGRTTSWTLQRRSQPEQQPQEHVARQAQTP